MGIMFFLWFWQYDIISLWGGEWVLIFMAYGTLRKVCGGLAPGCGGQEPYGLAAGAQGCGFCGTGCGDYEGVEGEGGSISLYTLMI